MSFDDAKRKLLIADHMLVMTYKQLKDPKLLVTVLDNLYRSVNIAMTTVLEKERLYKRIPAYQETMEGMLKVFREKILSKTKLTNEDFQTYMDIIELYREHKESDIEFTRQKQFVIANKDYRLRTLNEDKLKKFIANSRQAIRAMEEYHVRSI